MGDQHFLYLPERFRRFPVTELKIKNHVLIRFLGAENYSKMHSTKLSLYIKARRSQNEISFVKYRSTSRFITNQTRYGTLPAHNSFRVFSQRFLNGILSKIHDVNVYTRRKYTNTPNTKIHQKYTTKKNKNVENDKC